MLAAIAGAPASGKSAKIAAAGKHGCSGYRIIRRRVHDVKAGSGNRFRIANYIVEWGAPAFFCASKSFFQDIGDAASIIAGGNFAIDLRVLSTAVVQPPPHDVDELLRYLGRSGASDQCSFHTE